MTALAAAALALIAERLTGYPVWLYRRFGHPVEWIGRIIGRLEGALNDPALPKLRGRVNGVLCMAAVIAIVLGITLPVRMLTGAVDHGWIIEALLATPFLAQRSLHEHARAVLAGFDRSLAAARDSVSMIVGRDPAGLDESGVARAALESLAENTSDGIVAPLFWLAVAGLPGIGLYKAINTADSMIGHRSPRYLDFGWAAARLDDVVNLPASRLTGLLFAAAAAITRRSRGRAALDAMWRDAGKHTSPNAGWPEAALAGALDLRLGGPRSYGGHTVDLATMGHGRASLTRDDIRAGLRLYSRSLTLLAVVMVGLAAVV